MTAAIVGGLKNNGYEQIMVSNRGQEKLATLVDRYGVTAARSNEELVSDCDIVILSVKPQILEAVLEPLKGPFIERKPLVISVAAGIRCASLRAWCGDDTSIVRSMPNTPSVIGEGVTGLFAFDGVSENQKSLVNGIFQAIGEIAWVENESDLDLVTALSGSGPAYFMLFVQSMIEAAVKRGMSASAAKTLALQTARGTAGMIAHSEKELPQMIEDMLLPGGTTEQAVAALRQHGVPSAIEAAVAAASERAAQLADELGA